MPLRAPDAKYNLPRDTDRYQTELTNLASHDAAKSHGRWWVLDEWPVPDKTKAAQLRRKLVGLYGAVGFSFKVVVANDKTSTALLVRFDPPTIKEGS